jgi:molybdate-binding protein
MHHAREMATLHDLWELGWAEIIQHEQSAANRAWIEHCKLVAEDKRDRCVGALYHRADTENIEFYRAADGWYDSIINEERMEIGHVLKMQRSVVAT